MKASKLIQQIEEICIREGVDPDSVDIYFRTDYDSDIVNVNFVEEDLRDLSSNNCLISLVLLTSNDPT